MTTTDNLARASRRGELSHLGVRVRQHVDLDPGRERLRVSVLLGAMRDEGRAVVAGGKVSDREGAALNEDAAHATRGADDEDVEVLLSVRFDYPPDRSA
jgi:hypothetical protein